MIFTSDATIWPLKTNLTKIEDCLYWRHGGDVTESKKSNSSSAIVVRQNKIFKINKSTKSNIFN